MPVAKRRRIIAYDKEENVYYCESRSRHGFYHEVQKFDNRWSCNCEYGVKNNFKGSCSHIILVVWYIKYQPYLIEPVISNIPILTHGVAVANYFKSPND